MTHEEARDYLTAVIEQLGFAATLALVSDEMDRWCQKHPQATAPVSEASLMVSAAAKMISDDQ